MKFNALIYPLKTSSKIIGRNCLRWIICTALLAQSFASISAPAGMAAAGTSLPPTVTIDLGDGVMMDFVLMHPGAFSMGTDTHDFDEGPTHRVTISRPYYLGKFEVTQEQWQKVMGSNPSHFQGAQYPVESVSWLDCQNFLEALKKKTGRRFALPTEAQWEYACQAGAESEYSHGDDESVLGAYAWYAQNSGLSTHPVGKKKPNAWGVHDMAGNVYEWCADWYSEGPYSKGEAVDPRGPARGQRRILRGGGWIFVADNLRSSDRGFSPPDMRTNEYGLRCVLLVGDEEDMYADQEQQPSSNAKSIARSLTLESSRAASLDQAIADSDRLRAEFLLSDLIKDVGDDDRIRKWREQIERLSYPPQTLEISLGGGVIMDFVLISPGTFVMGSDKAESLHEKPAHVVTITRPFYLGKYEVTQRQWSALMSRNDSAFRAAADQLSAENLPVEMVNWPLAQSFLSKMNDTVPGYGFRLPTEAEWEFACRATSTGERHFSEGGLGDYAWYGENAGGKTHPVGQKNPNAWGLYDMYGNVWEWCEDRFGAYSQTPATDPIGPMLADLAGARVARGGAWNNLDKYVNSTFRHDATASVPARYYGFRCVASVKLATKAQKP